MTKNKRFEKKAPTEAPASWDVLLKEAVEKPGTVSAAFSFFHNYSVGNQLLAMFQCHMRGIAPGPIGTFKNWLDKGRPVRKGERAIILCQPRTWNKEVEKENGETEKVGGVYFTYRPSWFVLSQTDGPDIEFPKLADWDAELALKNLGIERVEFEMTDGNTLGYSMGGKIAISPVAPQPMAVLAHELGHEMLHKGEDNKHMGKELPRNLKEVEAEATAMIVLESLGLPGAEESRGYIQSWYGKGNPIPEKNAQRIFGAATRILNAGRANSTQAAEVD